MPITTVVRDASELEIAGYEAYLFDWDGTLADSHAANFASMRAALGNQGIAMSAEWFDRNNGVSSDELADLIARERGVVVDAGRASADRDDHYLSNLEKVSLITPVAATLDRLRSASPVALASGGGECAVLATVDWLGLTDHFDTIVTRADVSLGKPAPDIFFEAARRLGVAPDRCLVFEDSDQGVHAALTAGMDVMDVRALRPAMTAD